MKITPSKLTAVTLLCCLAALFAIAAGKIGDLTPTLTLADTNAFEVAVPGVGSYHATFGTLATNLAARLGLPVSTPSPGGGDWIINDQFMGDAIVFTVGAIGSSPWRYAVTGTFPPFPAPLNDGNLTGYLSLTSTQTASASVLYLGSSGNAQNMNLTNGELYLVTRIRVGQTNVSGDVSTLRIGITKGDTTTEPTYGAYFMVNTNVNTNTIVCVTARNSSRTFTYSPYVWTPMRWFNVGIYANDTNIVFYAGTNAASMTAIATNTTNLPGNGANMAPAIVNWRIASSGGLATQTNYVDWFRLWARSDAQ